MRQLTAAIIFFCLAMAGFGETVTAISVSASSYLSDPKSAYRYHPVRAFDAEPMTVWSEGVEGAGTGETIEIEIEDRPSIDTIKIKPGYFDPHWWAANNRIKNATIFINDDKIISVEFQDSMQEQSLSVPRYTYLGKFKLRIDSVYRGSAYDDTCISEISFYYQGKRHEIKMAGKRIAEGFDWQTRYDAAVAARDFRTVKTLLVANKDILQDQGRYSLLYKAVQKNNIELSVALLETGHVDQYWDGGYLYTSYLEIAIGYDFIELAKAIVGYFKIDGPIMRSAIEKNRLELVRLFTEKGFGPSDVVFGHSFAGMPIHGTNAFICAVSRDKFEIAEYLYSQKYDINAFDRYNAQYIPMMHDSHKTALDYALKNNNPKLIAWLKERGAKTFYEVLDEMSIAKLEAEFNRFRETKAFSTTDELRMRNRPGLQSTAVGTINKKDMVYIACQSDTQEEIDGFNHPWLYIVTQEGRRGWVYGGYIKAE